MVFVIQIFAHYIDCNGRRKKEPRCVQHSKIVQIYIIIYTNMFIFVQFSTWSSPSQANVTTVLATQIVFQAFFFFCRLQSVSRRMPIIHSPLNTITVTTTTSNRHFSIKWPIHASVRASSLLGPVNEWVSGRECVQWCNPTKTRLTKSSKQPVNRPTDRPSIPQWPFHFHKLRIFTESKQSTE